MKRPRLENIRTEVESGNLDLPECARYIVSLYSHDEQVPPQVMYFQHFLYQIEEYPELKRRHLYAESYLQRLDADFNAFFCQIKDDFLAKVDELRAEEQGL